MNELNLIKALTADLAGNDSVKVGVGDDCAILDLGIPDKDLLFKTDAIVSGIHFDSSASPEAIGRKALARPLSDIAAMGGVPTAALITLGLPENIEDDYLAKAYEGINALAKTYGVAIVGGETISNPGGLMISVSVIGSVSKGKGLQRRGGQVGDAIFVSGDLGGSLQGHHLSFEPRIKQSSWLVERFEINAMIDLSDGLASDLRHVLDASEVGAELLSRAIPISLTARQAAKAESSAKPPLLSALTDGEDYELLFTLAPKNAVTMMDGWKQQFPEINISCIGKLTKDKGLRIRDEKGVKPVPDHGYVHLS